MALPVTLSGSAWSKQSGGGPHLVGGNVYAFFVVSGDLPTINAFKATDPETSFSVVDTHDSGATNIRDLSTVVSGTTIFVIFETATFIAIVEFDTITDTFSNNVNIESFSGGQGPSTIDLVICDVRIRSDGDLIVLYGGDTDNVKGTAYDRVDYARREGSTWTAGIAVDNAGEINWHSGGMASGSSDRMHFFFHNHTNLDAYQRTLNSSNSLETFPSSFDTNLPSGSSLVRIVPGVSYDSAGTQKVRVPYAGLDGANIRVRIAKLDSADAPTVTSEVASDQQQRDNPGPTSRLAADGTDLHLLYSDVSTQDIWQDTNSNDGGWGTDVEVRDAVACFKIMTNIYTRVGSVKLAFLYGSGTVIEYDEITLSAPASLTFPSRLRNHMAALLAR